MWFSNFNFILLSSLIATIVVSTKRWKYFGEAPWRPIPEHLYEPCTAIKLSANHGWRLFVFFHIWHLMELDNWFLRETCVFLSLIVKISGDISRKQSDELLHEPHIVHLGQLEVLVKICKVIVLLFRAQKRLIQYVALSIQNGRSLIPLFPIWWALFRSDWCKDFILKKPDGSIGITTIGDIVD